MRDVTAHTYERMSQAMEKLRTHFANSEYEVIDAPLLEETELFVRKSGGELTNRLYCINCCSVPVRDFNIQRSMIAHVRLWKRLFSIGQRTNV